MYSSGGTPLFLPYKVRSENFRKKNAFRCDTMSQSKLRCAASMPRLGLQFTFKFVLFAVRGRNASEFRGSKELTDRNSVALQNPVKLESFVPVLIFDGRAEHHR